MEGISNKTQHKTQYTQQNKNITEPFLTCQALFLNPRPLEDRKGPLPITLLCWTFTGINMLYIVIIIQDAVHRCFPAATANAYYTKYVCAGTKEGGRACGHCVGTFGACTPGTMLCDEHYAAHQAACLGT